MRQILVFGAGRVARPCVQYLLKQKNYQVTVVDMYQENLDRVLEGHPRGKGMIGNAEDAGALIDQIRPDLVMNLLPRPFLEPLAHVCLEKKVHMINLSYITEEIRELQEKVASAGLIFLCELGLDPGIDHMSAAKHVRAIRRRGGSVESFRSICGALPSHEANTNPWGYKLSWAPGSLIGASKRSAQIMEKGEILSWPDGETYRHPSLEDIEGLGTFEVYANADSLPYLQAYDIPEAKSIFRGTLRYPGWCETIAKMNEINLFDETPQDLQGMTFASFMKRQIRAREDQDLTSALCNILNIPPYSAIFLRLQWLGLLDEKPLPLAEGSPRDIISHLYDKKFVFAPEERDFIALQDEFIVFYPEEKKRIRHRSLLVDYGTPGGDSAIARTTGVPPAICAKLLLEGAITTPGIHAPVLPEIYDPALEELEKEGIALQESEEVLS
jgi:saccharopine dehydrogenase-like NADP-dependent oxidoreductase